jgi:succinate dehydrogenase (ubiquinone) membrane anchor subunit
MSSPSIISTPIDYTLGVIFPFHSHVGLNYVISDYVPKNLRVYARTGLLGVTIVTIAGLFKLNYDGPGITESFKALWKAPEKKE